MQNPQQLQGIGSLRQPYGLGKLVKKAFRGVKKIAKSPLGKAALIGGLGMYGMGMGPFAGGSSMFGGKLAGMKGAGFLKGLMGKQLGTKTLGGWANRIFNPWQSGNFSGKSCAFRLGSLVKGFVCQRLWQIHP